MRKFSLFIWQGNQTETESLPLSKRHRHLFSAYHHVQLSLSARCDERVRENREEKHSIAIPSESLSRRAAVTNSLIDRRWVNFASLSWIEFFHFLDLSSTMIGTMGGKRTPEVQNYQKVSKSTENHEEVQKSAFPPLIGILSSIESELNILFSVSKWIPSFSRSSVNNVMNTLVDQRWVDFTSLSRWSFFFSRSTIGNDPKILSERR